MKPERQVTVNITNQTIARVILWVIVAVVLYQFIGRITNILTLIFASFFLALALNPAVSWIKHHLKIKSRAPATALAYLAVVLFLVGFSLLVIPPLVQQTRDFIKEVPTTVDNFRRQDSGLSRAVRDYNLDDRLSEAASNFSSRYSDFGSTLLNTGKRVVGTVASVLAVLVLTFMMLVEGPRWLNFLSRLSPAKDREHHKKLAHRMYRSVTAFVNGQVILAALGATFSFVALMIMSNILDVEINALALAGIVAVLSLIPLFGTIISATIVVLVCLLSSVGLGIAMLIYFIVYQQIENWTLQPFIQSRLNELTPLLVFIAALIGVGFAGLLGAIAAIPVASAIKILLQDQIERRGLGSSASETK